ncbi:hypothetical protein [uncultured Hyphomicrobium sp.]|uniref:hypothetical protein n=1 Tax=uncultured Hyphomicrobium sp. TaxID=194373 RepID=UPI0025F155AC|nr:hypothetical protein [uncultured Hyphomicrobium sp.]
MSTASRASARLERFAEAVRCGILRLIHGKGWACADYQRRHTPLAGPRPGARLD